MGTTIEDTLSDTDTERLATIRKLLAKAEATPYPQEAEAFMAKVSELIARWCIDEALVWAAEDPTERTAPIRSTIHVPAPYAARKAVLVNAVAEACGCQAVRLTGGRGDGHVALIGFEGDVRRAELLITSLLLQLTRDMIAATPASYSASATAAWRRSFIIGFANRIGERLAADRATAAAESEAAAGGESTSTALVLVDRDAAVAAATKAEFPRLRTVHVDAGRSRAGREAGRESANRADLGGKNLTGGRAALGG